MNEQREITVQVRHTHGKGEARKLRGVYLVEQELYNRTVRITQPAVIGQSIRELVAQHQWHVVFARLQRVDDETMSTATKVLSADYLLILVW